VSQIHELLKEVLLKPSDTSTAGRNVIMSL
jgi:hypothetical protein